MYWQICRQLRASPFIHHPSESQKFFLLCAVCYVCQGAINDCKLPLVQFNHCKWEQMLQACDMLCIEFLIPFQYLLWKLQQVRWIRFWRSNCFKKTKLWRKLRNKPLRVKIIDSEDSRSRESFSAEREPLKSHPIDLSSSPMSEDTFDATACSETEGWYAHVVFDHDIFVGAWQYLPGMKQWVLHHWRLLLYWIVSLHIYFNFPVNEIKKESVNWETNVVKSESPSASSFVHHFSLDNETFGVDPSSPPADIMKSTWSDTSGKPFYEEHPLCRLMRAVF